MITEKTYKEKLDEFEVTVRNSIYDQCPGYAIETVIEEVKELLS